MKLKPKHVFRNNVMGVTGAFVVLFGLIIYQILK